jgi:hypothetical protein
MQMSDKVEVLFSHPHDGHEVGDRVALDKLEAKHLVRAGAATYANKTEAAKAGAVERGPAKTRARKTAANRRRTSTSDASEPSSSPAGATEPSSAAADDAGL